ncbi:SMP-30/gluconolactonase/LRE family protein [Jannaschia rubra]|uniref:L-arabinolactonase n=1 Tax=Jannaschia rubra TaxID=282197 RepID=A0A0M6XJV9_9RHOB|nr:SMP-30/gluconolactonase/LRE family protein [Jannaschia rubra]CTQ31480.1 L-arabinolactonase [Jannaschia rubra]SFF78597.1 Sugar lactone lactonase YvrE [Jannaschia rubra]
MTQARVFDDRVCALGEGPLWHPEREQLFWFDITGQKLLSRDGDTQLDWDWDEKVSAAGWIDRDSLMVAGQTALWHFDIRDGRRERIVDLEADQPGNRSNDGRADPLGGFWIGTMGLSGEPGAGALYRYFRGEVRQLFRDITTPNSICFAPAGDLAYFSDTAKGVVWKQAIDRAGWPSGRPEVFADFSGVGLKPDGAVCDAEGNLWIAQWGGWRVACHGPDGRFLRSLACGAAHTTCPAFGGSDLRRLFVTSATEGLDDGAIDHHAGGGRTWVADMPVRGQAEYRVIL